MIAVYALGPLALIPVGSVALVVAFIFATAAIAGLIDGLTYRFTWSLPILAGVGFMIAKMLYFNDGTFIYAFGCFLAAAAGVGIGNAINPAPESEPDLAEA